TLAVPMALTGVEIDSSNNVVGAHVGPPGGSSELVRTSRLVLATGGFGANTDLVRKHIPEIADAVYFGSEGVRGTGLLIGNAVGADVGFLDAYQGHGSLASPEGILMTWGNIMHGGVIINSNGNRFADETIGYSEYARLVLKQPNGIAWVVI